MEIKNIRLKPTALYEFKLDSLPISCEQYGNGHVHKTFKIESETGKHYILQRMNEEAFRNIDDLMENIALICDFLKERTQDSRKTMTIVPTRDEQLYFRDETGAYRVFNFIEDSVCLEAVRTTEEFYECALAFGQFTRQLEDFPVKMLHETIANFHDTPDRYRIFKEKLKSDVCGRAENCREEIEFYLSREQDGAYLSNLLKAGKLPLRVTHNDTKINNVMLDVKTKKGVCVIDLDTTMPGLSAYDFGDSIRFGAATVKEDEKDYWKNCINLEMYTAYTKGFLEACISLTDLEIEVLPWGAKTMTLECGLRFLTDYLDGDNYFHTTYPEHNLVRSRTQMNMVKDMEKKWDEMKAIVNRIRSERR